jgi:hypothetical protein
MLEDIAIECTVHKATVVPADPDMNLIFRWDGTTADDPEGAFVIDESNLYCTGGDGEHEFRIVM